MFFQYRTLLYNEVQTVVKKVLEDAEYIALTLDKVTHGKRPYTVLCGYVFLEGKIQVLMIKIHLMRADQGDGAGIARMVYEILLETGLTEKSKICYLKILKACF